MNSRKYIRNKRTPVLGGLKVEDAGNGCKRLDLPTVQYGQSKAGQNWNLVEPRSDW